MKVYIEKSSNGNKKLKEYEPKECQNENCIGARHIKLHPGIPLNLKPDSVIFKSGYCLNLCRYCIAAIMAHIYKCNEGDAIDLYDFRFVTNYTEHSRLFRMTFVKDQWQTEHIGVMKLKSNPMKFAWWQMHPNTIMGAWERKKASKNEDENAKNRSENTVRLKVRRKSKLIEVPVIEDLNI